MGVTAERVNHERNIRLEPVNIRKGYIGQHLQEMRSIIPPPEDVNPGKASTSDIHANSTDALRSPRIPTKA
ncbi:hypothetical protein BKA69DRAFT_1100389 [Paraphysoderma sedebokerense]|nr:hypothetical protein BKA69DRAFT_1100389 [Paraphysoderma sedebokerense]